MKYFIYLALISLVLTSSEFQIKFLQATYLTSEKVENLKQVVRNEIHARNINTNDYLDARVEVIFHTNEYNEKIPSHLSVSLLSKWNYSLKRIEIDLNPNETLHYYE